MVATTPAEHTMPALPAGPVRSAEDRNAARAAGLSASEEASKAGAIEASPAGTALDSICLHALNPL